MSGDITPLSRTMATFACPQRSRLLPLLALLLCLLPRISPAQPGNTATVAISGHVHGTAIIADGMVAGLHPDATDGYDDGVDIPKPAPPATDYLDVYFPHPDWAGGVFGPRWAVDIRDGEDDLTDEPKSWALTVATDQLGDWVSVEVAIDPQLPTDYAVELLDLQTNTSHDLRLDSSYAFCVSQMEHAFELLVGGAQPPGGVFISPVAGDFWPTGSDQLVEWNLIGIPDFQWMRLQVSSDGGPPWRNVAMFTTDPGEYLWHVPSGFSVDAQFRLRIKLGPGQFLFIESDPFAIGPTHAEVLVRPGWQMLSLPLHPYDNDVAAIFGDDLLPPYFVFSNPPFWYEGEVDEMVIPYGYWLGSSEWVYVDVEGVPELEQHQIGLVEGWNMIGSGLPVSLHKTWLQFLHEGDVYTYAEAVGGGLISPELIGEHPITGNYRYAHRLDVWRGYWLMCYEDDVDLLIAPTVNPSPAADSEPDAAEGWLVAVHVEMGTLRDATAGFGVHPHASEGFDSSFDLPAPPVPRDGGDVRAVMERAEWRTPAGPLFSRDIRAVPDRADELVFPFVIQATEPGPLTLRFGDEDGGLPDGLPAHVSLTAIIDGNVYNLREQREFVLNYAGSSIPVVVHVNGALDVPDGTANGGLPVAYELAPARPNPFNPTTRLTLFLPAASAVTLTVYNIAGQRVATLAAGQYAAGVHRMTFDGAALASGIYFIHASVPGELNTIQKVTLMK